MQKQCTSSGHSNNSPGIGVANSLANNNQTANYGPVSLLAPPPDVQFGPGALATSGASSSFSLVNRDMSPLHDETSETANQVHAIPTQDAIVDTRVRFAVPTFSLKNALDFLQIHAPEAFVEFETGMDVLSCMQQAFAVSSSHSRLLGSPQCSSFAPLMLEFAARLPPGFQLSAVKQSVLYQSWGITKFLFRSLVFRPVSVLFDRVIQGPLTRFKRRVALLRTWVVEQTGQPGSLFSRKCQEQKLKVMLKSVAGASASLDSSPSSAAIVNADIPPPPVLPSIPPSSEPSSSSSIPLPSSSPPCFSAPPLFLMDPPVPSSSSSSSLSFLQHAVLRVWSDVTPLHSFIKVIDTYLYPSTISENVRAVEILLKAGTVALALVLCRSLILSFDLHRLPPTPISPIPLPTPPLLPSTPSTSSPPPPLAPPPASTWKDSLNYSSRYAASLFIQSYDSSKAVLSDSVYYLGNRLYDSAAAIRVNADP